MKRTLTALALTLAPLGLASVGLAHAADDGLPGTTSTGTVELKLNVTAPGPQIEISGLQDLSFAHGLGEDIELNIAIQVVPVCVYMSEAGTYNVTLTGTPLTDGATVFNYSVAFRTDGAQSTQALAMYVEAQSSLLGTSVGYTPSGMPDCSDGPPTTLRTLPSNGDIQSKNTATNGPATATVTVTVAPD